MAEPEQPPRRERSGLLVRLPLLVAFGLGLWLWQGGLGLVAAERELVFQLPADRAELARFEYQLTAPDGEVLRREERRFGPGPLPAADFTARLPLQPGTYPLQLLRWYEGDDQPRVTRRSLEVRGEAQLLIDVPSR